MPKEIENEYNKLNKKYKLPEFNEVNVEFEISSLEDKVFLLRNILRKIIEKLEFYIDLLSNLLQPDAASLSSMHELRFFTEEDKNAMYRLFKKLMKAHRSIIEAVLETDEKSQADYLKDFFVEWKAMKKELLAYVKRMRESWDKDTSIEEDVGYFG
jgi:hypothetical protein